ncbi:hypothetical protein [uncultured Cohaesibacter sp.]|uniref:hypothetical protein n=1 Tax=uncultured Cohaesibacter sp. TaxID=1002546 RepID=UPI002930E951|nr:hypothetical protein [uncultured Cohaesibacter sp.]
MDRKGQCLIRLRCRPAILIMPLKHRCLRCLARRSAQMLPQWQATERQDRLQDSLRYTRFTRRRHSSFRNPGGGLIRRTFLKAK